MDQFEYISPSRQVCKRTTQPYVYLYLHNQWFCYDPNETPIGKGAMGTVYIGYNTQTREPVAIKRILDTYANNPLIRQRAKQEASLSFKHPNLIEIVGYCEWADDQGPIFIISHLVKGANLTDFINSLNIPVADRAARITEMYLPLFDALDYVHSRGVVHRDIKPSNIMMEEGTNLRLMDLGIARMNGGNKFSSYGFIGTPQYAAPEQVYRSENSKTEINPTTDIYAAGVTLYELISGVNPFDSASYEETLFNQIKKKLPADPLIPRQIFKVIVKATQKDQKLRYQSALEFKQALTEALKHNPKVKKSRFGWLKRYIWVILAVVVAVLAIAAALILI